MSHNDTALMTPSPLRGTSPRFALGGKLRLDSPTARQGPHLRQEDCFILPTEE
jgi:hypothetical protein